MRTALLLALVILSGCVSAQRIESPKSIDKSDTLGLEWITLAWECQDWGSDNTNYLTGLESSTNLCDWETPVLMDYQPFNFVTVSNRPPTKFYRAFNTRR